MHPELHDRFQCRHCQRTLTAHFGNTAIEIISYPLEHTAESFDEKAVRKLIKKGAKAKSDKIIEAVKGYNIETDPAKKLELARGHLECLDDMITQSGAVCPYQTLL